MSSHVAHQFEDAQQQLTSAKLGMWLFLATEVLFFGGLFAGYLQYRTWYPEAFAAGSHHLSLLWGTTNTTILLLSSYIMALAVNRAQAGDRIGLVRRLIITAVLGIIFLGIKGHEYLTKFHENLVPGQSFALGESDAGVSPANVELFFSFYFAMTGLHAAHMIIGVGALAVVAAMARRDAFSADYFTPVEMTGLYWHFVDVVWVFLFPLLYLIA